VRLGDLDGVQGAGQRFGQDREPVRHVPWHTMAVALSHDRELGESAVVAYPVAALACTQVGTTEPAHLAPVAPDGGIDHDTVSCPTLQDVAARVDHLTDELVTGHDGEPSVGMSAIEKVPIGTTHSTYRDPQKQLVGRRHGRIQLDDVGFAVSGQDDSSHVAILSSPLWPEYVEVPLAPKGTVGDGRHVCGAGEARSRGMKALGGKDGDRAMAAPRGPLTVAAA
jgi:hypothetical protein